MLYEEGKCPLTLSSKDQPNTLPMHLNSSESRSQMNRDPSEQSTSRPNSRVQSLRPLPQKSLSLLPKRVKSCRRHTVCPVLLFSQKDGLYTHAIVTHGKSNFYVINQAKVRHGPGRRAGSTRSGMQSFRRGKHCSNSTRQAAHP